MTGGFEVVPAGDAALVVEFEHRVDPMVNARALAVAESLSAMELAGVRDIVPTFCSVAVYFDPLRTDVAAVQKALSAETVRVAPAAAPGIPIRIPVCYGGDHGPDLPVVAAFAGMSEAEVIGAHAGAIYRVFMLGFVPGFAYLGSVEPRIATPRRATPRVRVPAGSVGIAGVQTGIYPIDTPGGWQLIGRTPVRPFDMSRDDPFMLRPGYAVEFYPIGQFEFERLLGAGGAGDAAASVSQRADGGCLRVVRSGFFTTIQDQGRWGWQALGVPVAGPMDLFSHRAANALVRNDPAAATFEITLEGPELEFSDDRVVAVTGAEFALTVDGVAASSHAALIVGAGSRLRFGERRCGSRSYLAVSGGLAVSPTLGSRSTHVGSRMGGLDGRPLKAGDRVPLGQQEARLEGQACSRRVAPEAMLRPTSDTLKVRVLPGRPFGRLDGKALEVLQSATYAVGADSDRMGFRLEGPGVPLGPRSEGISEVTPVGTIQILPSGQPVLLMADRQATGGYPRIATVITADMGMAGQLAPGDRVAFEVCTMGEAVRALMAQERLLMSMESPSAT